MILRALLKDITSLLKGNVLVLFLTWVLLSFGNNMVHKFDGLYFSALGASNVVLGYMGAITFGMMALLQIPGGHLADTLGRKKVILIFTFVMAFSMLIFALAPSWEYIVVGLIIANVALLYQPALFSIVMDSLPPSQRAEGFAVTNLSSLPALFAPMVGGALILKFGLVPGMRIGYFILFILSITAAFMRFYLKETVKRDKNGHKDGFMSFFKVIKNLTSKTKIIMVSGILVSSASGMVSYFIVKYTYTYTSPFVFGIVMGINMLIFTVVGLFVGRIGDLRGKERFFITGALLIALSLAVFVIPSVEFLIAYVIIAGLGSAFYQPSINGLIADLVSIKTRGRFTGVFLFLSYTVAMIFSIIAGYIYQISPQFLFTIASGISLIGALIAVPKLLNKRELSKSL